MGKGEQNKWRAPGEDAGFQRAAEMRRECAGRAGYESCFMLYCVHSLFGAVLQRAPTLVVRADNAGHGEWWSQRDEVVKGVVDGSSFDESVAATARPIRIVRLECGLTCQSLPLIHAVLQTPEKMTMALIQQVPTRSGATEIHYDRLIVNVDTRSLAAMRPFGSSKDTPLRQKIETLLSNREQSPLPIQPCSTSYVSVLAVGFGRQCLASA